MCIRDRSGTHYFRMLKISLQTFSTFVIIQKPWTEFSIIIATEQINIRTSVSESLPIPHIGGRLLSSAYAAAPLYHPCDSSGSHNGHQDGGHSCVKGALKQHQPTNTTPQLLIYFMLRRWGVFNINISGLYSI